jgi:hypothetical protein
MLRPFPLALRLLASRLSLLLVALVSISIPASYAQNSAVNFIAAEPVPLANACNNVFAGHFHSSASMDFMTTCTPTYPPSATPNNTAMLNQGNGTYTPVEDTAIDQLAVPVAAADLNGDGWTDLVVNESFSPTIGVQLSNGNGTFKAPVYYTPSQFAGNQNAQLAAVVTGDFNGDGKTDVAIIVTVPTTLNTGTSPNTLIIYLNEGAGVLKQTASYTLTASGASQYPPLLAAGNLNGDHETDLAVVYRTSSGTAVPYFATGAGTFKKGSSYSAGTSPEAAVIGNFTSSGYGDIAVTGSTGITMLLGDSSDTFTNAPFQAYPYPAQYGDGARVVAADFDMDGNLDLAMTAYNYVYVLWGNGNGAFSGTAAFSVPQGTVALLAADLRGNGEQDLATSEQNGSVNLLLNVGHNREFVAAANTYSGYAAGLVAADFNGDGKKDVAVVNTPPCTAPCSGKVTVFPGTGSTYFNPGKSYTIGMHGSAIAVGDVNGDGVLDLVVTNATPGDAADVSVLLGIKGGGFQSARNYTLGSLSNDAFLVDMNKDGKLDLVEDGGIALGKGDGTFGPLKPFPDGIVFGRPESYLFTTHLAVGDLNGDGVPDVAASYMPPDNPDFAQVWVLLNDGKGNLTGTQLNDSNGIVFEVTGVAIGKLQGGSINDIVLANNGADSNGVSYGDAVIFMGDGKGNFTESNDYGEITEGGGVGTVTVADFNHDGINDIGLTSLDEFVVLLGQKAGSSAYGGSSVFPITSGSSTNPQSNLAVADFNGDGWPDVVLSNTYGITRLYDVPVPTVSPDGLTWTASGVQKVTIKNSLSTSQAIQAAIVGTTESSFKISGNTCGSSLAAGATCTISVEYISGKTNIASDTLYVRSNSAFIAQISLFGY